MKHVEVAEQIARDTGCAQGEFNQRVLSIIPYLTEHFDEIARLTAELAEEEKYVFAALEQMKRLTAALKRIADDGMEMGGDWCVDYARNTLNDGTIPAPEPGDEQ